MQFFQILDCSSELGTCCGDYGMAMTLNAIRKIVNLIQIIAPIILIVMGVVGLTQLVMNPEKKDGLKTIVNKIVAAVIIFFLPIIVDIVLGVMPESFQVSACWKEAKRVSEVSRTSGHDYISPYGEERQVSPILIDPNSYEHSTSGSSTASGRGAEVVSYARRFVGQPYVWGGTWNGELPYTGTDCSGFVQGIFKHFGINLTRTTDTQWADTGTYTRVNANDIRAGDLVMYDGHVGILTGNGRELIHAKGRNYGVVIDPDYSTCSSHTILGFMRINGIG